MALPAAALSQHIAVLGKTGSGKTCTRCGQAKPLTDFGFNGRAKKYRRSHCKACDVNIAREYRKTPAGVQARKAEHRRRFARHYRVYATIKDSLCCSCCSEADPACIDLHHLSKKAHRRNALSNSIRKSVESIIAEFCKCAPLCANCHRKLHAGRLSVPAAAALKRERIRAVLEAAGLDMSGRSIA